MQRADFISWRFTSILKLVILIQLLMNISIVLDITFFRQIVGFIYLTFVPGMLLLKALKLKNLNLVKSVLFSVGLSIALLMLVGLLVNELCPLIGISKPLSTTSLIITMNLIVSLLCFIGYYKNRESNSTTNFNLSPLIVPLIFLPILSVSGTFLVNYFGNNFLLLLTIALIAILVTLGGVSKKLLSPRLYPFALLMITFALLFHTSLITNYIIGWDVHAEYYVFESTRNSSQWTTISQSVYLGKMSSMLSVTILPTIYSQLLRLSGSWTFKILYPFILSFIPFGLYELYRTQIKKNASSLAVFLSTFFFVSISKFFGLFASKQMVGELFYVLLLILILDKEMKIESRKRKLLFTIFGAALVVSHYSISYMFLFFISFTWLSLLLMRKKNSRITLSLVAFFFVVTFSWYVYTSESGAFSALMSSVSDISQNFLVDFFNPQARGSEVLRGTGLIVAPSVLRQIGRISFYITEFFILTGFVMLILKKIKLDEDYVVLAGMNMALLLMTLFIPNFADAFRMGRIYHLVLFFLAPLCILGGKVFFVFLLKLKTEFSALILILVLVLIPLLLFETEFVYTIAGENSGMESLALNMKAMDPVRVYSQITLEQEVLGARWLSTHMNTAHAVVCGEYISVLHVLTSYGMIPRDRMLVVSNFTMEGYINLRREPVDNRTYIYLRRLNIVNGVMGQLNVTEIYSVLDYQNKIYSNGDCEIHKGLAISQP